MARILREVLDPTVREIPLAFIDTETTSVRHPLLPRGRRTWEIAVIRRDPDGRSRRFAAIVEDPDLTHADPKSLEIGRFHQRHPRFGGTLIDPGTALMPEVDVAYHVADCVQGAQLVALNVAFDADNATELLNSHGLYPEDGEPWDYHTFELGTASSWALGWRPPYSGSGLARRLGLDPDAFGPAHVALTDALWHERWYDALWRLPLDREALLAAAAA